MFIGERQLIGGAAREFKSSGYNDQQFKTPPLEHASYGYQNKEALQAWYEMKPELYALTAVMLDRVVDRAEKARFLRPPFGLIQFDENTINLAKTPNVIVSVNQIADDQNLISALHGTLLRAAIEESAYLSNSQNHTPENSYEVSVYNRLEKIIDFRRKYVSGDKETVGEFIGGGAYTAATVMSGFIHATPKVFERDGLDRDPDELTGTLSNSFPAVADLAMRHMYDFDGVTSNLLGDNPYFQRFTGAHLALIRAGESKRLIVGDSAKVVHSQRKVRELHKLNYIGPATIGCPAMVRFDGRSAVQKLWNWNVDIAEEIYKHKFGEKDIILPTAVRR